MSPNVSKKLIEALKTMPMRDGIRYALNQLIEIWQQHTDRLKVDKNAN
jgi:hypothetical protein